MRPRPPGAIHHSERAHASAKRLRNEQTGAERRLWKSLRNFEGRFRRQAPFGPFIVDFVSHRARLIVEVDGGVHQIDKVIANDIARDRWLGQRGYRVLRFSNDEVMLDADTVLERIASEVRARAPVPGHDPQTEVEALLGASIADTRRRTAAPQPTDANQDL